MNSCGSDDVLVHVFTIIDSFSESFFVHRGEIIIRYRIYEIVYVVTLAQTGINSISAYDDEPRHYICAKSFWMGGCTKKYTSVHNFER